MLFKFLLLLLISAITVFAQFPVSDIRVRLADGLNDREGRVEIYYNRVWGTICDDGWDVQDAAVICNMVGFSGLARGHSNAQPFGPGSGPIHLSNVACDGNEQHIAFCSHGGWNNNQCTHAEDAGVTCLGVRMSTTTTSTTTLSTTTAPPRICNNPNPNVRLVDGPNQAVGRVQVRNQNRWWAVCDDAWDISDARVICRMLCYNPVNARAHLGNAFGNTTQDFLLDDVNCVGNENNIFDCKHSGIGVSNCDATEGAGVSCMQDSPTPPPLPTPEVDCSNEIITAKFLRSVEPRLMDDYLNVTENNYDVNCDFTSTMDVNYVSISIPFTSCNTQREKNDTHIWYYNVVRYYVPPEDPTITRTEVYYIPVTCVLPKENDPSNEVEPLSRTAPPRVGDGKFSTALYLYENNRFENPVKSFPVRVTLGDWVYAGVVLTSKDQNLKVVVPRCWTTPEVDKTSTPQYDLINDGCTVEDSVTLYPINETMFGFRFQSFRFIGNHTYLYLHCEAFVCESDEKTAECDRSCSNKKRRKRDTSAIDRSFYHMEKGPIIFQKPGAVPSEQPERYSSNELMEGGESPKSPKADISSAPSHLPSLFLLIASIFSLAMM